MSTHLNEVVPEVMLFEKRKFSNYFIETYFVTRNFKYRLLDFFFFFAFGNREDYEYSSSNQWQPCIHGLVHQRSLHMIHARSGSSCLIQCCTRLKGNVKSSKEKIGSYDFFASLQPHKTDFRTFRCSWVRYNKLLELQPHCTDPSAALWCISSHNNHFQNVNPCVPSPKQL